jgi:hypothetical protein
LQEIFEILYMLSCLFPDGLGLGGKSLVGRLNDATGEGIARLEAGEKDQSIGEAGSGKEMLPILFDGKST